MQKAPYVFPIIGGRKVEHMYANLEALEISLSPEQIEYLEGILPFQKGFPYNIFVSVLHALHWVHWLMAICLLGRRDRLQYYI